MKRFFLTACLGWLLAASANAQVPHAAPVPSVDLGAYIGATEEPCPSDCRPSRFWKRTAPAEACEPEGTCVGPGACAVGGTCSTADCWQRFKSWLCYRSNNGKLLPCLRPTPYQPPLYNWFPCAEGCATGCGPWGCGGPPITYYYPSKEHPAPPQPKIELRGPQTRFPGTGTAMQPPANKPTAMLPGLRFASAETPAVADKKRTPGITPASAVEAKTPAAPPATAARPGEAPFGYHQSTFKKYEFQP